MGLEETIVPDRILLQNLVFYGYHGVRPEEQTLGQRFNIDLTLELDLGLAGRTDDLMASIDYSEAYSLVRAIVEGQRRSTIEAVAESCAAALLERFTALEQVKVRVSKPAAPIAGAQIGLAAVEIERTRSNLNG